MGSFASSYLAMGVDVPMLLWIGGALLVLGLFFALAGRRPARRERKHREEAARIGADAAATREAPAGSTGSS